MHHDGQLPRRSSDVFYPSVYTDDGKADKASAAAEMLVLATVQHAVLFAALIARTSVNVSSYHGQ